MHHLHRFEKKSGCKEFFYFDFFSNLMFFKHYYNSYEVNNEKLLQDVYLTKSRKTKNFK